MLLLSKLEAIFVVTALLNWLVLDFSLGLMRSLGKRFFAKENSGIMEKRFNPRERVQGLLKN